MTSILSRFNFKGCQEQAVMDPSPAIIITAGAGSGKTRTLVGRYLHLLEQGYPLRSLIAITFTDKAAREMRSRIRSEIEAHLVENPLRWEAHFAELDSARIGTIHSLCAEILRAHPAEAAVDPNFTVLDEGLASALKARAVETALAWTASEPVVVDLFGAFKENELRRILTELLNRRLDLAPLMAISKPLEKWSNMLKVWLDGRLNDNVWMEALEALATLRGQNPDDILEAARLRVLALWGEYQQARAGRDWEAALSALAALRKAISTQGRKENWHAGDLEKARECMKALREHYDTQIAPLLSTDTTIRWLIDEQVSELLPAAFALIARTLEDYQHLKDERHALDFDDLEGLAAYLLDQSEEVRARWQEETRAVLVDEFQDTNPRQRRIVYALAGFNPAFPGTQTGELFIVGDAKQSIYKFRGADVTVFRQVQDDIAAAGGLLIDLGLTFRTHKAFLDVLDFLLAPILGEGDEPSRPYQVRFMPVKAYRQSPARESIRQPYLEFHIGCGEDAESGRAAAASALAHRLHELRDHEGFDWGQMALLFRSSSAFEVYEDALEESGIPFVTVAGRGFYDRPEIRDLLNALAAIANPADDLALAGLLRSPAIGLSDADLYHLRFPINDGKARPFWASLLDVAKRDAANARAFRIIGDLHTLAGRALVSEVLKRFLDLTGYRAILGAIPQGRRMQRNVDKLLADAHRSRLVSLGEFLEYIQTLRDVGLREGEAPVEVSGAVQLMTVHKAKGLEFPLVVICDAAHEYRGGPGTVLLDEQLGLLLCLRDEQTRPVAWQLANLEEAAREDAENKRLLYVAATRAREKLIVSGHTRVSKSGRLNLRGWLGDLGRIIQLDQMQMEGEVSRPRAIEVIVPERIGSIGCVLHPPAAPIAAREIVPAVASQPVESIPVPDMVAPFIPPSIPPEGGRREGVQPEAGREKVSIERKWKGVRVDDKTLEHEADPPRRVWRVVSKAKRPRGPAWVVGKLVHEALRHWRFPDAGFDDFMKPFALEAGLTDPVEIRATIRETSRLLERFRGHPLFAEMDAAERYHEVPYFLPSERGVIDVLYRTKEGWFVVDFKTDAMRSETEARQTIQREGYDQQVQRYADAIAGSLGQQPRTLIVFLQVGREVKIF